MYRRMTIAALLIGLVSQGVWADKLYKVVDEKGNITFSQFPPKEKSANAIVESVHVRSGDGMVAVKHVGNRAYCGNISLPKPYTGSSDREVERYANYVNEKLEDWRNDLRDREQDVQDRSSNKFLGNDNYYSNSEKAKKNKSYQRSMNQDAERMKELRCAINWAEKQRPGNVETLQAGESESSRLEQVHAEVQGKMIATCGHEPLLDPTDAGNAKARRQWKACSKKFRKDLDAVESQMYRR